MNMMFTVRFTEKYSTAELTSLPPEVVDSYNREFSVGIEPDNMESTLYFNRLFSRDKNLGIGTTLMNEVVDFLDQHNFSVILEVNPYFGMDLDRLIGFYERFGFLVKFRTLHGSLMVRQQHPKLPPH